MVARRARGAMSAGLCALALAAPLAGAARASGSLEEVLVTGTYAPRTALTASVSVLDAARIRALNKRTVAGLLKTVPGLLVEEQGGPGGLTAVSIRGGEANFTLVLLDGVPVNDPTNTRGGGFDFANLNTALVERIEVVRGAQSAVYGSDALAGVINIITRRPREGHGQSLFLEGGEDDFYNLGLGARGVFDGGDYSLDLARRDDGEPVPGSTRDSDSARLRLGLEPAAGHRLDAAFRYLEGDRGDYPEQSGGPALATSDALEEARYRDRLLALDWTWDIGPAWRSRLAASRFEHDERYDSPGIPPFFEVPPNGADTHFKRDQLQWVHTWRPAAGYRLDAGADLRREAGDSRGYVEFGGQRSPTDFRLDRDTAGVFVQGSAAPADGLLLEASLRRDEPEGFDGETSWLGGVRYALGEVTVSGNLGEAFKLPSFFALGNPLVGNPDLAPETARSRDVGVAWRATRVLTLGATWFDNDYEDLVDFDDATFRNVNRRSIDTSGVELEADWRADESLRLGAVATWTDIDVGDADTVLTGRPQWSAGLVADWDIAPRWQGALDYRYTGTQWAASRHTGEEVTRKLDDYHRVDAVLRWRAAPHWHILLSADNLLDADYETAVGFEAPGRALRLGLRLEH